MGATNVLSIKIKQEVVHIHQEQKYNELIKQLQQRTGSVLVFVKTKHNSKNLAAKSREIELLLVDTAGRLQNKKNLMAELSKIASSNKVNLSLSIYCKIFLIS